MRVLFLMALGLFALTSTAEAALTRSGPYVGARHIEIRKSLEEDMRRAGVPEQCREEAHQVLTQYVFYGYDTAPALKPRLDILCAFTPVAVKGSGGEIAKALGQRGTVGGLRYIRFHNTEKEVKRVIVPLRSQDRVSFFSRFVQLATLTPLNSLQCQSGSACSRGNAWATPIAGARITSEFGHRHSPGGVGSTDHKGMDFGAACGTPIMSVADGVVIRSAFQAGGAGNYCKIRHADGVVTEYFHMPNLNQCVQGATVRQGQQIGAVGNTGASTGCHLHFGTAVNGVDVNPRTVLASAINVPLTPEQAAALSQQYASAESQAALIPVFDSGAEGGLAGQAGSSCYKENGSSRYPSLCEGGATNHAEEDHDHDHEG